MKLFESRDAEKEMPENSEIEDDNDETSAVSPEEIKSVAPEIKSQINSKIEELGRLGLDRKDVLKMIAEHTEGYDLLAQLENPDDLANELEGMDRRGLELWRQELSQSIAEVGKNKKGLLDWIHEHKGKIKIPLLALYFSSGHALADILQDDLQIETDKGTIHLNDMAENAEFKEAIDFKHDIPVDVLQAYAVAPLSNKDGFAVNFAISEDGGGEKSIGIKMAGTFDVQGSAQKNQESMKDITEAIQEIVKGHASGNSALERMSVKEFEENRDKLVGEISSAMNIPSEEVSAYFDKLFESVENPSEKVSVVPLENFEIDKDFNPKGEMQQKYDEIIKNYNLDVPEEKERAIKEFEDWGKEKGHDNVWSALSQEKLDNPFSALENYETRGVLDKEIYGKFLANELQERGYDLDELKNDREKAIDAIMDFVAERQGLDDKGKKDALEIGLTGWANNGDNINKALSGERVDYLPFSIEEFESKLQGDNFMKELVIDSLEKNGYDLEKLSEISGKNPKDIIPIISEMVEKEFGKEKGFDSEKQVDIFMGVKHVLTEIGVQNLDKFVVIESVNEEGRIVSKVVTIKDGKFVVSEVSFSSIGDKSVKESERDEKIEEAHNSVLKKIKEVNIKERLGRILKF